MDTALWAVWSDLAEGPIDEYLHWMHEEYLPALRQRPGVTWVAHYQKATSAHMRGTLHEIVSRPAAGETGTGSSFIQLVGATDPLLLFSPSVIEQEARKSGRTGQMLGKRVGTQSCILGEMFRVNGPELRLRPNGTTPSPAIQMGMLRLKSHEAKHALSGWYANNRLPLMAAMPGAISARVFACLSGWPEFAVLYEFRSLQDREDRFEPQETQQAIRPLKGPNAHPIPVDQLIDAPGSPQAAQRIWPAC